ncbi:transporter substrate-binding domain-containing protein [Maribrevibacterium harenarium]|uniref:Transporter substrate-binding domain-containing protein n=2 Tax=Maribrevibacterium harenarium TaxID=2589817 RepID=A0A501WUK7_9GAMM|nr:transporter substrate-binding domain-containing protein [Maribrevibacterium harenarium]
MAAQAANVSLTTLNWPPFVGDSLDRGGFINVIVQESLAAAGYTSDVEFTAWQTALDTVKAGEKDAVVGGYYSEARAKDYLYSIPLYTVMVGVIKTPKLDISSYDSFTTLNNYKIGKVEGFVTSEAFDNYAFSQLQVFKEVDQAVAALEAGKIDLYADSLSAAREEAKKQGMDPMDLQILIPPLEEHDLYLLVSKAIPNSEELRNAFNKGLIELQASGRYEEILKEFNQ